MGPHGTEASRELVDVLLTLGRLRKILPGSEAKEIKEAVTALEQEYEEAGHAFSIVEFGGGWQIATKPEFSPVVEKMLKTRRFTRLSKAGLEVLAIIAYRQPLTRLEVDEIRGVNSSGAISTLSERNLITVVGRSQAVGNPLLYGTTREFLNHLGLKGLGQLPDLPDLEMVMDDRDELKEFASRVGRDVTDEELADYFEAVVEAAGGQGKLSANWVMGDFSGALNKAGLDIDASPVSAGDLGGLLLRIEDGTISGKIAKQVFEAMWNGEGSADAIIEQQGLKQISDSGAIEAIIQEVLDNSPKQIEQYRGGQQKVFGYFVGQVMKATQGKANPKQVNELLRKKLDS